MVKKRKFAAYRAVERPYTRFSKKSKYNYVHARPPCRIALFDTGNLQKPFEYSVYLVAKNSLQIRDLALESARLSANRLLEKNLGKTGFRLKLMVYPHHVLRENPLASGAGADRMSTGMQLSFGKTIGVAAQIKPGQRLFKCEVEKQHVELARKAMHRASFKLPCSYRVEWVQNTVPA
ncbi:50S ribosomal protein L16 [Candidatus Woesearchaeota archaeon]|nr:50S ribosomal protein L16 [Candidatus Woesearchaeota archaeon]